MSLHPLKVETLISQTLCHNLKLWLNWQDMHPTLQKVAVQWQVDDKVAAYETLTKLKFDCGYSHILVDCGI